MFNFFKRVFEYYKIVGVFGICTLLLAYYTKDIKLFKINFNQTDVKLRMPSTDVWVYKQIFIDEEYKFTLIKQPKVIIDAGANIGLASIYFANLFPEAKIIALEPERKNFELLSINVKQFTNIIPIQGALWSHDTTINICDVGLGDWGFMTSEENMVNNKFEYQVQAFSVDSLMKKYDFKYIDILKIDIEGAEKEVFMDTTKWLNNIDSLIVELHDRMKSGCSRAFYNNTEGFKYEWVRGENVYLSKGNITEF